MSVFRSPMLCVGGAITKMMITILMSTSTMTFEINVLKGSHATPMSQSRGLIIGHVPMPRDHPYKFVLGVTKPV